MLYKTDYSNSSHNNVLGYLRIFRKIEILPLLQPKRQNKKRCNYTGLGSEDWVILNNFTVSDFEVYLGYILFNLKLDK